MRIGNKPALFSDRPFTGDGYSLYVTAGDTVQYRNHRLIGRSLGPQPAGKGARVGTIAPGGTYNLPLELLNQDVSFDVRRFHKDVENESDNYRTANISIDGSGEGQSTINGHGSIISQEILAGGIVRIRMRYFPARDGIQPNLFRLTRTAGPTSPADITLNITVLTVTGLEFTTTALSDASAYTYTIRAENGATTKELITGLSVNADATGPTAPTAATAKAW